MTCGSLTKQGISLIRNAGPVQFHGLICGFESRRKARRLEDANFGNVGHVDKAAAAKMGGGWAKDGSATLRWGCLCLYSLDIVVCTYVYVYVYIYIYIHISISIYILGLDRRFRDEIRCANLWLRVQDWH